MKTRWMIHIAGAVVLGALTIVSCNKRNYNHAPACNYGFALVYDDAGYQCRYVTLGYNYGYPTQQPGQNVPGGILQPPIAACPAGQILVNWRGAWLCYFNETIYPAGGDSPSGPIPPPGRGGEYCTSVGMQSGGYGGYGGYMNSNYYVGCSPGFYCQQGAATQPQQPYPTTGYTGYQGAGGSCIYRGYPGY